MSHATLMDEDFPARIEAVFSDGDSARAAASELCQRFNFDDAQFTVVCHGQPSQRVHRNRYAFKASGSRLQKRQVAATMVAFALIILGMVLLHFLGFDRLPPALTGTVMVGLILAAVAITVTGMLSWRPARIETRHRMQPGEAVLVVHVHDVSEQYALRDALMEIGGRIEGASSASVS